MSRTEFWLVIVQGAAAVGTLALAVLAIWGEWCRARFARPQLTVALRKKEGERTVFGDGRAVRYHHLVVKNNRRWAPARNVMTVVTAVNRLGPDGSWQPKLQTGPLPLTWQFGGGIPNQSLIGSERVCDLGLILKGEPFRLALLVTPNSLDPQVRKTERMRVTVRAVAETAESSAVTIEVSWDGEWEDGDAEMGRHLVVRQVAG
jgi:hypothetical protein